MKQRQPPIPNQSNRSTWALLNATYHPWGTEYKWEALGAAESLLHQQQGQKGKLTGGITVPHTSTHFRGEKKGRKSQASKRKRTPLLVYTSPSTGHFMSWVFRHTSCWVLLGTNSPTGIWKQTTVFPRQKENREPMRWKMSWRNRATSHPSSPDLYKRDRQLWEVTVKWCATGICSWHFSNE